MKNILYLAPHTDDEIHLAATLAKFNEQGDNIDVIAFSYPLDADGIIEEFKNSCNLIKADCMIGDVPVRNFQEYRQKILDMMVDKSKEKYYDLVICPSTYDTHQDHEVITKECFRAFKYTTIWGFQVAHNNNNWKTQNFSIIEERHIKIKQQMINCYMTQKERPYFNNGYFMNLAKVNGTTIRQEFAEVFENIRTIIK